MSSLDLKGNQDWQRLLRHFELIDSPAHRVSGYVILLVPNTTTAASCREDLTTFLKASGATIQSIAIEAPQELAQIAVTLRHISIAQGTGAVWVEWVVNDREDGFDDVRAAWQHAAVGLNRSRDTLLRSIPAPIVLVGAPWLVETLRMFAPDLWSARSLVATVFPSSDSQLIQMDVEQVQEALTTGDPEFALQQAEKHRRERGPEPLLAVLLTRAATLFLARGNGTEARRLAVEATELFRVLPTNKDIPAATANELAILNYKLGAPNDAMALLQWYESYSAEHGDLAALARSYGNQSLILRQWGRLDEAMAVLKKQESICSEIGDRQGLQACLGNQAIVLTEWGQLDAALALLEKQAVLSLELGDQVGLAASYGNQSRILKSWGRLDEAMSLLKKQEAISAQLGDHGNLARSYGNQALILQLRGQYKEALARLKQQQSLCHSLNDRACLAVVHANQGQILRLMNRHEEAQEHLNTAISLFRELGMTQELAKAQSMPTRPIVA